MKEGQKMKQEHDHKRLKPLTDRQRTFIRKAFMIDGVQEGFNRFFDDNFIYSENVTSFVHRLYDQAGFEDSHRSVQHTAFEILDYMRLEYLYINYDEKELVKLVDKVDYQSPLERMQSEMRRWREQGKELP